jgi:coproporphyrinogen III oxidase-like Fe-S oxidoreductase
VLAFRGNSKLFHMKKDDKRELYVQTKLCCWYCDFKTAALDEVQFPTEARGFLFFTVF